jgi:hypothetical protein
VLVLWEGEGTGYRQEFNRSDTIDLSRIEVPVKLRTPAAGGVDCGNRHASQFLSTQQEVCAPETEFELRIADFSGYVSGQNEETKRRFSG